MKEKTKLEQRLLPFWRHPHKIIDQSSIHQELKKSKSPHRKKSNQSLASFWSYNLYVLYHCLTLNRIIGQNSSKINVLLEFKVYNNIMSYNIII